MSREPREEGPHGGGRPLDLDAFADSADPALPAFLARPAGAPVYHGFHLYDDVEFEGFQLGAISTFEDGATDGDAFIVAPDESRAGLVWDVGSDPEIEEIVPFEVETVTPNGAIRCLDWASRQRWPTAISIQTRPVMSIWSTAAYPTIWLCARVVR